MTQAQAFCERTSCLGRDKQTSRRRDHLTHMTIKLANAKPVGKGQACSSAAACHTACCIVCCNTRWPKTLNKNQCEASLFENFTSVLELASSNLCLHRRYALWVFAFEGVTFVLGAAL